MQGAGRFLVLFLFVFFRHCVSNEESEALGVFKNAVTNDPQGRLSSWDMTLVNPCTWFYVTCDNNDFVTRLDLQSASLVGSLVPELGSLQHLQYLEVNNNSLTGSIPGEFGKLTDLISMDLYQNTLSGTIPESLGNLQQLKYLRLNDNMLSGNIPESLTQLSNLQVLDVSHNNLSGSIPTSGVFASMGSSSFQDNSELCGPSIYKQCP